MPQQFDIERQIDFVRRLIHDDAFTFEHERVAAFKAQYGRSRAVYYRRVKNALEQLEQDATQQLPVK